MTWLHTLSFDGFRNPFFVAITERKDVDLPFHILNIASFFTPYGYKFEGKDEFDEIYEQYAGSSVGYAERSPWRLVRSGYIYLITDKTSAFSNEGHNWSNTSYVDGYIYNLRNDFQRTYAGFTNARWMGFSVW